MYYDTQTTVYTQREAIKAIQVHWMYLTIVSLEHTSNEVFFFLLMLHMPALAKITDKLKAKLILLFEVSILWEWGGGLSKYDLEYTPSC